MGKVSSYPSSVAIVVPTRNESGNVSSLVARIDALADDRIAQIVFVDDSDDHTPAIIAGLAERATTPIRLIHREQAARVGGLGGAVVAGLAASDHDWVCVMDGDLQHPPEVIPSLIDCAAEGADVVVASRRPDEARPILRRLVTDVATWVAKLVFPVRLGRVHDPLTGFFLVDRRALPADLQPNGFKILVEILVKGRSLGVREVPFDFGDRVSGRSKASMKEGMRFFTLLVRLRLGLRAMPHSGTSKRAFGTHVYDIHGIITIASQARLPELEWFRTDGIDRPPDILIRVGKPKTKAVAALEFHESLGWLGFAARIQTGDAIEITVSRLVGWSPHVLYTNVVEPVLRWEFVNRGYALVHAACVEGDDMAYLVTARTDTGKTTTILKILEAGDVRFVSDDLCLVGEDGVIHTYPKPMTISRHTVHALNVETLTALERLALGPQSRLHSRSGRRIGLGLAETRLPAATMNALVQLLVPPPKYHVSRVVPGVEIAEKAVPFHLFIIARGPESTRTLSHAEALEMLMANCEDAYGFPPYSYVEEYMLFTSALDLKAREAEIIGQAIEDCAATLIQSVTYGWATPVRAEIEADRAIRFDEPSSPDTPAIVVDLTNDAVRDEAVTTVREGDAEAAG